MGKPTGFMEIKRQTSMELPPEERIQNFNEFHVPLHTDEQQAQGARCMDCGVPFCQSGMLLGGMYSGCPLNNLIPEWNDLVYQGKWDLAVHRLIATNRYPEFTSRVCPALCEAACTCGMATGDPVTVKENERERRYPRRAAAGPHRQDGCGHWCRPCGAFGGRPAEQARPQGDYL